MTCSYLCSVAACVLVVGWPVGATAPAQDVQRSPLTSIGFVSDLDAPPDEDDPGTGGGLDATLYFVRRLVPEVRACTSLVRDEFSAWAKAHQLATVKTELQPANLLMHVGAAALNGFFELRYRVDIAKSVARGTLYFYSPDGARHEPAYLLPLLKKFGITEFQDRLQRAMECPKN